MAISWTKGCYMGQEIDRPHALSRAGDEEAFFANEIIDAAGKKNF